MGRSDVVIVDVQDVHAFESMPPCADPRFDHRSCDYWEDAVRGSKSSRPTWWQAQTTGPEQAPSRDAAPFNPFAPPPRTAENPFAPAGRARVDDPFAPPSRTPAQNPFAHVDDPIGAFDENPFAPVPVTGPRLAADAPRKLRLLDRGHDVFGSYAKVLLLAGEPAAYAQFGPLSAYPRAQHIRELYPRLPQSPLPAVITCIASTAAARGARLAARLVEEVCNDLAQRGFSAVEAYPDLTLSPDEASAATPAFWQRRGFSIAAEDDRYPVMRRELA